MKKVVEEESKDNIVQLNHINPRNKIYAFFCFGEIWKASRISFDKWTFVSINIGLRWWGESQKLESLFRGFLLADLGDIYEFDTLPEFLTWAQEQIR